MRHLLDVNVMLAAIWDSHVHHQLVFEWLKGKDISLCPLAELGFIRVSTQPRGYNFSMGAARQGLEDFRKERKVSLIHDDLDPLQSHPKTSGQVPDLYLADLASRHGMKMATLDTGIKHSVVELIS